MFHRAHDYDRKTFHTKKSGFFCQDKSNFFKNACASRRQTTPLWFASSKNIQSMMYRLFAPRLPLQVPMNVSVACINPENEDNPAAMRNIEQSYKSLFTKLALSESQSSFHKVICIPVFFVICQNCLLFIFFTALIMYRFSLVFFLVLFSFNRGDFFHWKFWFLHH